MKFLEEQKRTLKADKEIYSALLEEEVRQSDGLELIASENYASEAVMAAAGSLLTNKYAEGLPGRRYYGGCEAVDKIEDIARKRALELFGADAVNVQPHSGSQANAAVFLAALNPGDLIMGLDLNHGGHLTHGSKVNFSGKIYHSAHYALSEKTELLDYGEIRERVKEARPKMLISGGSAYPRAIDFKKMGEIAKEFGALHLADMSHIAGLVASGLHQSPIHYADFVTTTTHKTLRGPRGGIILTTRKWEKKINSAVFPGTQGGPLMHIIAAKGIAFGEALQPSFVKYSERVIQNARIIADRLAQHGFKIITGGTDNHLILVHLGDKCSGKEAERALEMAGITVNKNTVPGETRSPFVTSGIRLGTPAITTRGMGEAEAQKIGDLISLAIDFRGDESALRKIKEDVMKLCRDFPIYKN